MPSLEIEPTHKVVTAYYDNAGQVNKNDDNKSRKYPELDRRVAETPLRRTCG